MRSKMMQRVAVSLLCVVAASPLAQGQAEPVTTTELLDASTESLTLRLAPMRLDELELLIAPAMEELQRSAFGLAEMLRLKVESKEAEGAAPAQPALDEQITAARTQHGALISRVKQLLNAAEAKGADVVSERLYVQEVSGLGRDAESAPTAKAQATTLDTRLDEMIAEVQAMPPVHERPEPWAVSVDELTLELQPLQSEQIAERVKAWQGILQLEVRKRIRIDIALQRLEAGDEAFTRKFSAEERTEAMKKLAERSQQQQVVVEKIAERTTAAVNMLKRREVDVAGARNYVAASTGQRLNLLNPSVLRSQVQSWAVSPTGGVKVAINVGKFVGVLLLFWVLSRIVRRAVSAAMNRMHRTSSLLKEFMVKSVSRVTMVVGIVAAISAAGFDMYWALAMIGAAGLVVGLALQGTLSNFASGLLILFYRPFDVGNVVTAGGVNGKVDKLSLFTTTIMTFDNQVMHVPNNEIWGNVITNATGRKTRRVDLTFGVGYGDDLTKAQSVLEAIVAGHTKVLKTPEPVIKLNELADSSVNFIVRPWVNTADYWDVYWDLMRQVKERFDAEGLNIPFPQRDLHVQGPIEVKLAGGAGAASLFGEAKGLGKKAGAKADA